MTCDGLRKNPFSEVILTTFDSFSLIFQIAVIKKLDSKESLMRSRKTLSRKMASSYRDHLFSMYAKFSEKLIFLNH